MPSVRRTRIRTVALVTTAALAGAAGAHAASDAGAPVREPLAVQQDPPGAQGRTLGLTRVTVPRGAALARHHHAGIQVAYIDKGTLTYAVHTQSVKVMTGPADDHPRLVRTIKAGQTGEIHAGQWIVERPSEIHQARNATDKPVVILLATLFPNGAPPSIPNP